MEVDGKKVEQGFAKLVLTPVELVRRLMEKQALRMTEKQCTTEKQIQGPGTAFMKPED